MQLNTKRLELIRNIEKSARLLINSIPDTLREVLTTFQDILQIYHLYAD